MTLNNIYEFFENDNDLLKYFDPTSEAKTNLDAANEVYHKLIDHSKERPCEFVRNNIGYIFFSGNLLISFCVKTEYRTKENLYKFGGFIKEQLGNHFDCYLFNRNERGIKFLEKMGLKKIRSNNLITHLCL